MNNNAIWFDQDLFVNREEAIRLFLDTVHSKTQPVYLEFNAIAGQGKTELLKWIYHHGRENGYYAAYVDFARAEYQKPGMYSILGKIASHLSDQIVPDPFYSFKEYFKYFRDSFTGIQPPDQTAIARSADNLGQVFNENLKFVLNNHKIVLCLDSTEKALVPLLRTFEQQVLKEHYKHRNLMLVTAGQEELVWKQTAIKTLVRRYELRRLNAEAVLEQMNSLANKKGFRIEDNEVVLKKLCELTLGHPLSSYTLLHFWTDGFERPLQKTVIDERLQQSVTELVRVIEEKILEVFQLSEGFPPAKQILWYIAPLRHIEFAMFHDVLSDALEDRFRGKSTMFFKQLMGEFQQTYILKRRRFKSGFKLEPVVRNILVWDMRTHDLEYFIKIHAKLVQLYDSKVEKTRDITQIINILESLYHYATYLRETQPHYVNALVKDKLQYYLDTYFTPELDGGEVALHEQLDRLCNELEWDEELPELVDVPELLKMIKERMEKSEDA